MRAENGVDEISGDVFIVQIIAPRRSAAVLRVLPRGLTCFFGFFTDRVRSPVGVKAAAATRKDSLENVMIKNFGNTWRIPDNLENHVFS